MKIKVKPEGRLDIYIPEKKSLIQWIKFKKIKLIHNFIPSPGILIGADHNVKSVIEDINNGDRIAILLKDQRMNNMGHALAIIKNEKLEMYDIGEVKDSDLEII